MREIETQPGITTADLALTSGLLSKSQKLAYTTLLNWQPDQSLLINNNYRLMSYLGRGGFGLVFSAHDQVENRTVALKFIHPGQPLDPRRQRRLERELEVAQKMRHPNLVRLYSLEIWEEINFLVMDFIPGQTVQQWIMEKGAQPWSMVQPLARQLLDVLTCLHRVGIVHRDIKPSNLILTPQGSLLLLDFGLSRELTDTQKTSSTGELIGSPHYLPPELIMGRPIKPTADIYQFGLVLHFMLSGRHPYAEEEQNTAHILGHQLSTTLRLAQEPHIPKHLRLSIQLCLEKDPARRPRDGMELSRLLEDRFSMTRLRRRLQLRKPLRFSLLSALAVLVLSLGLLFFFLPASRVMKDHQTLIVQNALGRELWRKTPVSGESLVDWIEGRDEQKQFRLSAVYTRQARPYTFSLDTVKPEHFSIIRRCWTEKGMISTVDNFIEEFMMYYDFYPFTQIQSTIKRDLDGDGFPELIILSHHAGGMFPSMVSAWGHEPTHRFCLFSPGRFDMGFLPDKSTSDFLPRLKDQGFLLMSNPFCHYFIWIWNIGESYENIPPMFNFNTKRFKTTDLIILPQESYLVTNEWAREKRMVINSPFNDMSIEVNRSGRVTIRGFEEKSFSEDFLANASALSVLNRTYFHLCHQEVNLAVQAMKEIVSTQIQNPWLLSLISYYKGETAMQGGDLAEAGKAYREALSFDRFNSDAQNRLFEIKVLEKGPEKGLDYYEQNRQYSSHFWGLGVRGQNLFRFCCLLMAGHLNQAENIRQQNLVLPGDMTADIDTALIAISTLYQPRETDLVPAIDQLTKPQTTRANIFDITELQLMLARLRMAKGDWQMAEPQLRHFNNQTVLHKPFAEVSLAWCEAEAGKTSEAAERAERAFTLIQRMAKGNFWARYWLFYDAYAYGRTMERVGLHDKAKKGYRLCIRLAPSSFLARDAESRIR